MAFKEVESLPDGVQYGINTLVEHSIEKILIVGCGVVETGNDDSEMKSYHVRAYTVFGLVYADIYVTVDSEGHSGGGSIERKIFFRS